MGSSPHSDPEALFEISGIEGDNECAPFIRCVEMAEPRIHGQMARPSCERRRTYLLPIRSEDGNGSTSLVGDKDLI
jgi:hypothetical protein